MEVELLVTKRVFSAPDWDGWDYELEKHSGNVCKQS